MHLKSIFHLHDCLTETKMRKLCICGPVLQALSFIILLLPWNLQSLFCSILLFQQMVGDCSPNPKATAEETDVLLKKKKIKQRIKLKIT